ncbi:PEP-utilizing enzyme [Paenibacillus sedimenti]|uniref:PEP-utilizing protein n=1 Tax=Paenibacillus sedimenti TaxID=2770274 RepID=A0A926KJB7_9BACL|nr:PEP-utilizing enzyme [Paenibacillus sedimenti]MBD0378784.1 PEP-utilizing protein [Paenibacillus sedimenti]
MSKATLQQQITLTEEEKQQGFWVQDDVHLSHALTPLFASFMVPAVTEGTKLAFENLKFPLLQFRFKLADGRIYQENVPYPGNPEERLQQHKEQIGPILPMSNKILQEYVDNEFLPFYRRLDDARQQKLSLAEAKEKVQELIDFYRRAWQLHFEIVMPRVAFIALEQLYTQLTGQSDSVVIYELLSGVMNKSLETDRELWKLADWAKTSPELVALFASSQEGGFQTHLQQWEAGRTLLARLQDLLEVYGYRTANSHEFNDETWVENPEHALQFISAYVQKDYDFDREFEQTVRRRELKTAEVLAKMPEGELKQTFITMLGWALDSWGLDEDHHFYIDAMLPAKSRLFLLNLGDLLVEQDIVASRSDIFYLYADELLEVLSQPESHQDKVEARKGEHEANKRKQAAPFYGTPSVPMDPVLEKVFGGKPPEIKEQERTFTGYAASQGTYTGTVKVIRGAEDFGKLQNGDVLVCRTTTPPWTVLFSIAGAIVTDAGGILSHAGTVAREYKLPAVVGSKVATSLLKDGDKVTVDGTKGVVYFGQS